jgi:hypothetical protein
MYVWLCDASAMFVQPEPVELHRAHWYEYVIGAVPLQARREPSAPCRPPASR